MATGMKALRYCVLLAALLFHGPLAAQSAASTIEGERVRISLDGAAPVVGVVESQSVEVLTVRGAQGEITELRLDSVSVVERSLGTRSHALKGLAIGGGAGLVAGAAFGYWIEHEICGSCDPSGGAAVGIGAMGLAAGGLLGLVIGAVASGEKWESVSLPGHDPVAIRPLVSPGRGRGLEVGLSVALR